MRHPPLPPLTAHGSRPPARRRPSTAGRLVDALSLLVVGAAVGLLLGHPGVAAAVLAVVGLSIAVVVVPPAALALLLRITPRWLVVARLSPRRFLARGEPEGP